MYWYVYIAKSRYGHYYVGISNSPLKRIERHNDGRCSQMARQQGPFTLEYVSNLFLTKAEARERESQIKRWTRIKKEKLISGQWT